MLDLLFAALPILFLIAVMTKPRPWPVPRAFLAAAFLAFGLRWIWFGDSLPLLGAAILAGLLNALTPISIVFGAILFFVALEKSGALEILKRWLRGVSPNPVAQLMLVGWSFMFLIEGVCGFGTPAALAAPILVGLGFPAIQVAIFCLVLNTIPVVFGAVGTPLWFGLEPLGLEEGELLQLGFNAALLAGTAALVVPVAALRLLVSWREIQANLLFIYLSILAGVVPMTLVSLINYEFPSVVGGTCAVAFTLLLARFGVGLKKAPRETATSTGAGTSPLFLAVVPLAATVLILLVTRIPALGLRGFLTTTEGGWIWEWTGLGRFQISPSVVVAWQDIVGQGLNWSHAFFYVPSIVPFFITAGLALWLFGKKTGEVRDCFGETTRRIQKPVLALFGALVFVQLIIVGGAGASTMVLGSALAGLAGGAWFYFAPFLGALGSFFSGSATISNLTFGTIQHAIAVDTGLDPAMVMALQSTGAAAGNMVCIHNIVAVCAVLSLVGAEGRILKTVFPLLLLYGLVLSVAATLLS